MNNRQQGNKGREHDPFYGGSIVAVILIVILAYMDWRGKQSKGTKKVLDTLTVLLAIAVVVGGFAILASTNTPNPCQYPVQPGQCGTP